MGVVVVKREEVEKLLDALDKVQPAPRLELEALAGLMDHTCLRPEAVREDIVKLAEEAKRWKTAVAYVHASWAPLVRSILQGSGVKTGTVVDFPFGGASTRAKRAEAEAAILAGAEELDMVLNIGALKSGDYERVETDIRGVADISKPAGVLLKVILETAYLTDDEKAEACRRAERAGADTVKTSTGFGPSGATADDIKLMRSVVGQRIGVKAAGGIRTLAAALEMLRAGASRLGTSSTVSILEEARRRPTPSET
jgi:deoxyribose-phosphate aldolase